MPQQFAFDGQAFGNAASALQKSIRRGEIEDSIYWALNLYKRTPYYVPKRLAVIAIEDIGLADILLVERILANLSSLHAAIIAKKNRIAASDMQYAVANIVKQMAQAKKSREADEFQHHIIRAMRTGAPVMTDAPTYDEKIHILFRCIEEKDEIGAGIAAVEISNGYAEWLFRDLAVYAGIRYSDGLVSHMMMQLRDFAMLRLLSDKKYYEPLVLGLGILLMTRSDQDDSHVNYVTAQDAYRASNGKPREMPEYAKDMHTGPGRAKGRSMKHFTEVGAHIENKGYESKYSMWDEKLGSGGMLADDKTRVPDDWQPSIAAQNGAPHILRYSSGEHMKSPTAGEEEQPSLF